MLPTIQSLSFWSMRATRAALVASQTRLYSIVLLQPLWTSMPYGAPYTRLLRTVTPETKSSRKMPATTSMPKPVAPSALALAANT